MLKNGKISNFYCLQSDSICYTRTTTKNLANKKIPVKYIKVYKLGFTSGATKFAV